MKTYAAVFLSVFVAELGDKTQLATLLFASNPETSKVGVFLAAAGALVASSLLAVLVGERLGAWLRPDLLKMLASTDDKRVTPLAAFGLGMIGSRDAVQPLAQAIFAVERGDRGRQRRTVHHRQSLQR